MNSLYKINENMLSLLSVIEANEGELTDEVLEQLEINNEELQTKSESYLAVIKNREALNTQIDDEVKRLQAMKKANNNLVLRLKNSLLNAVNIFGEFETGLVKFGIRKSTTVEVTGIVNDLPKEYKTVKVTEQPNKAEIKKSLQKGEQIEGCALITNYNLKIN
tara:strand:- start:1639 stop:2127 length:489 start_codon:yes stop_codon:yes gene_type:complete